MKKNRLSGKTFLWCTVICHEAMLNISPLMLNSPTGKIRIRIPPPNKKIPGVRIWFIRIRTVSFCFVLFLLHFAHYSLLFNNNKIIYRYGTNACVAGCLLKRRPSCRRAAALSSVPTVPHPAGWNS